MNGSSLSSAVEAGAPAGADLLEREFLDLVYADEELLRAEFDALMAASWGASAETGRTVRNPAGPAPRPRRPAAGTGPGADGHADVPAGRRRASARSPPAARCTPMRARQP
jgi:hypothetical protein